MQLAELVHKSLVNNKGNISPSIFLWENTFVYKLAESPKNVA